MPGDGHPALDGFAFLVHPAEQGQRCVGRGVVQPLEGRQLGGLVLGHTHRAVVSADKLQQRRDQTHHQSDPQRRPRKAQMPLLEQIPRADADDQERARLPRAAQGVKQPVHRGGIEHHLPEVGDLGAGLQAFTDNVKSRGRLHPGVRHHDPNGTEVRPQTDHAGGEEMQLPPDLVPAEQQDRQET